ncbi:MBL fold metallo-hydrolase [Desertibacillus haloalkaliphilus]|uniref:MBL fold metallo-hydrolase n=1 Tax=Desertibacillus haloalkaliphilus TaxID=1328930 RepID=UPI001C251F81|nr:MBL fold metallo-hydrolase [Desertibacillus haloalkaliphilus]MBU8907322.1 MBL fold metallo-hydrolase [Desertibacillus haloalkaliphilus]
MNKNQPIDLGNRIHLIDGFDLGLPERTGTYVIQEDELTIVETGPSMSIPYVLEGLKTLQLDPRDVRYIIVTHIHLDHSGGAGLLLKDCPNATVVVHPRGARHLIDPTRLIKGARAVYGDDFDKLFEPIVPIPEEKVIIKEDGETLAIGSDCTLRFYNTPGHSDHHFSIYDPVSNGMFTGDTIGIKYDQLSDQRFNLYLPTTSPNQFKPDAMLHSLERIKDMNVERIYFGHFGVSTDVDDVYQQVKEWIPRFVAAGEKATEEGRDYHAIAEDLLAMITDHLKEKHVPDNHPIFEILKLDTEICAMGIADYLAKRQKQA